MVSCGVFEYVDTLLRGRSREETSNWVQVFDVSGRAMALRPDLTPSIARMAAPLLDRGNREIRWCYAERIYRRAHAASAFTWSGTMAAESTQVGVEWLGKPQTHLNLRDEDGPLPQPAATPSMVEEGKQHGAATLSKLPTLPRVPALSTFASAEDAREEIGVDVETAVDAAVLGLCADAVRYLGLKDWQLVVGHAGFTPLYLEARGVPVETTNSLLSLLAAGDYVGFRQQLETEVANGAAILAELTRLNPYDPDSLPAVWQPCDTSHVIDGGVDPAAHIDYEATAGVADAAEAVEATRVTQSAVTAQAAQASEEARKRQAFTQASAQWDSLTRLAERLRQRGIADRVSFDLTLCRDLTYYTGIVFEVFAEGTGAPIALGGRYNDLLSHFGTPAPAIGFTFEIEGLMNAMPLEEGSLC